MRILSNSKDNSQEVSTNVTEVIQPEGIERSLFIMNNYDSIINEESGETFLNMCKFVKINWNSSTKPEKMIKSIANDFTDFISGKNIFTVLTRFSRQINKIFLTTGKQLLSNTKQTLFDEFFNGIGKFLQDCFKLRIKTLNENLFLLQKNITYSIDVNLSSSLKVLQSLEPRFHEVKRRAEEQKAQFEGYLLNALKEKNESIRELNSIHLDTHFISVTADRILAINPKTSEEFDSVFESQCLASWEHYLRWLDFNFYKKIKLDAFIAHGNSLFHQTWTEIFEMKSLIWGISENDSSFFKDYFKAPVAKFTKFIFWGKSNWQKYSKLNTREEKEVFICELIRKKYLENNLEDVDCKAVIAQLFTPLDKELQALQKIFKAKNYKQELIQINRVLLTGLTAITRWMEMTYLSDCGGQPPDSYQVPTKDNTFNTSINRSIYFLPFFFGISVY